MTTPTDIITAQKYISTLKKSPLSRQDMLSALNYLLASAKKNEEKYFAGNIVDNHFKHDFTQTIKALTKQLTTIFLDYQFYIEKRLAELLKPLPYIEKEEIDSINKAIQFFITLSKLINHANFNELNCKLQTASHNLMTIDKLGLQTKLRFAIFLKSALGVGEHDGSHIIHEQFLSFHAKLNLIDSFLFFYELSMFSDPNLKLAYNLKEILENKLKEKIQYLEDVDISEKEPSLILEDIAYLKKERRVHYCMNLLDFMYNDSCNEKPEIKKAAGLTHNYLLNFFHKNKVLNYVEEISEKTFNFLLENKKEGHAYESFTLVKQKPALLEEQVQKYIEKSYSVLEKNETPLIHQVIIDSIKNTKDLIREKKELYLTKLYRVWILYLIIKNEPQVTKKNINIFWEQRQKNELGLCQISTENETRYNLLFPEYIRFFIENILEAKDLKALNAGFDAATFMEGDIKMKMSDGDDDELRNNLMLNCSTNSEISDASTLPHYEDQLKTQENLRNKLQPIGDAIKNNLSLFNSSASNLNLIFNNSC